MKDKEKCERRNNVVLKEVRIEKDEEILRETLKIGWKIFKRKIKGKDKQTVAD